MAAHVLREGGMHPSHYVGAEIPIARLERALGFARRIFRGGRRRERWHAPLFQAGTHAHPEHRGRASRFLRGPRRDRGGLCRNCSIRPSGRSFIARTIRTPRRICGPRAGSISFGFAPEADYRGTDIDLQDFASVFCVFRRGEKLGEAVLNVPGRHNVSNALGVIALATELGIPFEKIVTSLRRFEHARRRFEIKYESDRFLAGGRLRASSHRDSRHARDREIGRTQSRSDDVSAASLLADQGVATASSGALSITPTASS